MRITITNIGPRWRHWGYFDWVLTGLGLLAGRGEIELAFDLPPMQRHMEEDHAARALLDTPMGQELYGRQEWCMAGAATLGGKTATFAYDIHDAPHVLAWGYLEQCDLYFKCQHPAEFNPKGFKLAQGVRLPYHPDVFVFMDKIRPAMLGRPLSVGRSFDENMAVLGLWAKAAQAEKTNRFLALYSSDAAIPPANATPRHHLLEPHGHSFEEFLVARPECQGRIHHPNLKRGRLLRLVRAMGLPECELRIRETADDTLRGEWFWGAYEYPAFAGSAIYNLNVSGHARSIPFRFVDSFLVGATVVTDTLGCRWYREFEPAVEVVSLGDMGYELDENVDWQAIAQLLAELNAKAREHHARNARRVRSLYREKWAPPALARYMVRELRRAVDAL